MRTLRPSDHPSLSSPSRNAATRSFISGWSSARLASTTTRRARRERPRRRAAEQRDELAALHSITSSARASSVGGTVGGVRTDIRGSERTRPRKWLLGFVLKQETEAAFLLKQLVLSVAIDPGP